MDYLIHRVIELAKLALLKSEFPVGALVVKDDVILGEGYNLKESSHDPTAHAEVIALRAATKKIADWRLTGSILISTLEPCPMCLGAILQARVKKVIYLAQDIRWGACGSVMNFSQHDQLNHQCELEYLPNDDVVNLMKSFFRSIGKRT
jgi:tRNA(adenine34) deaminase